MKELTQKQKGILLLLSAFVLILVLVLTSLPRHKVRIRDREAPVLLQEIPDGEGTAVPESKSDGYRGSAADYWDALDESMDGDDQTDDGYERPGPAGAPEAPTVEQLFGPAGNLPEPEPRAASGGGTPARRSPVRMDTAPAPVGDGVAEEAPVTEQEMQRMPVKRSGAVSSLDEDVTGDLGTGFSSLDSGDPYVRSDEGRPYKCMFTRSEKVSSGQRISVRLLEDLLIGDVLIPQNTHLSAVCQIASRMEVTISSVEIRGRILRFRLEGYDTDGGKGIYCSDLSEGKRTATEQGISTISSALSSRLGRVANDAATVGASIVRSKTGEVTVEVPAGYVFYVIESKDHN